VALLYFGRLFVITLVVALTIALLLDPLVNLIMRARLPRSVASFVACVLGLLFLYLVGLAGYTQLSVLAVDLPTYTARAGSLANKVSSRLEQAERMAYDILVPKKMKNRAPAPTTRRQTGRSPLRQELQIPEVRIRQEKTRLINYIYNYFRAFYEFLLMASFVPFLVYFMLSWKDHLRRSYLQLFRGQDRHAASRSWEGIADMARVYVLGNFVLGVLLSIASTLIFWALKLPYFLLIGPLSGFLSLVPYIGLPLAMAPPFFVAIGVHDRLAPFLIIAAVVGFLHLLALNLLYPKLVGSRVHLNPLAVTVALMFFGVLWGGAGLVLAIPIAAGIKAVCDNVPRLQPYGKLLGD